LFDVAFSAEGISYPQHRRSAPVSVLREYLMRAEEILRGEPASRVEHEDLDVGDDFEHLRWFLLPEEAGAPPE
jgi:hypothetical protein